jgi:hypothetical protein
MLLPLPTALASFRQTIAVIGFLVMAGCTFEISRDADMVPINDAANAAGVPKLYVVLYGTGYGPATVIMPDGIVLQGHYRLAVGGAVATGIGTANGPS